MIDLANAHRLHLLPSKLPTLANVSARASFPDATTLCPAICPRALAEPSQRVDTFSDNWPDSVHKACDGAVPNSLSTRPMPQPGAAADKGVTSHVSHVCDVLRREGAGGLLRARGNRVQAALLAAAVLHLVPPAMGLGERI